MTKELLISSSPHETKVAVLEDDQLVEVYFQRDTDVGLVGGIYKGRVNRVLPGMQSAFVDVGLERDAFLYVSDFFEDSEEYDRVFTEAENRVARLTDPGSAATGPTVAPESPAGEPKVEPQPAALEPVPPAVMEAATAAPEEVASPESAASSIAPPKPERVSGQSRPHEFPGRRNRRRGRRFGQFRYGNRREPGRLAGQRPESGPAQGIELLPGESLAKYGHAAGESSPAAVNSAPEQADRPEFETPAAAAVGSPQPESPLPATDREPLGRLAADESSSGEDTSASTSSERPISSGIISLPAEPEEFPDTRDADAVPNTEGRSPVRERNHWKEDDADAALRATSASSAAASPAPQPPSSPDLFSETRTETAAASSSEGTEPAAGEPTGASGAPRSSDAAESAPSRSSETGMAPEPEEMAAGRSYTLREPSHRSRVAPRQNRRGRGRFRGQQGRRRDVGYGGRGPEPSRAANHQPLPINELLREGQEILVQIAKEPLGTKGARITSHIALPGRYLVCMPTIDHIGVSRKIASEEERLRLRNIILENRGSLTGGFIVRTAAAGRSDDEIKADLAFLTNLWNDIRSKAERIKAPALLHRDLTLVERILRDLLSPEFKCLRVDSEIEYEHILDFVNRFQPSLIGHVKLYTRDVPLFEEFGVQAEIDRALKPKVWLKSGGYIVINQTEALVAIDVNTGKYVGKTNRLEDTIVKTNIDAVKEIVRQIRLRDLGGIIVIDFIDMDERRNRTKVVQALDEALRHDRAPTKILSFNEFGLVALTRKRVKHSLERALCEPCPYCTGAGWVKSVSTVSYEIFSEARKMALQIDGNTLHLRVNPEVAATLKARDGVLISEIEAATRKDVVIKADPNVHQEQFEIY
jgi:Rne/Rng family ribonuclease